MGIGVLPAGERFIVEQTNEQFSKRFGVTAKAFVMRAREIPARENALSWISKVIRDIHGYLIAQGKSKNVLLGVSVDSDKFSKGAGGLSIRPIESFSVEDLLNLISSITQSNQAFALDDSFVVRCTYIETPMGSGRPRTRITIDTVSKRSFITIKNNDNLCLPRALVIAQARLKFIKEGGKEAKHTYSSVRDWRRPLQKLRAEKLVREAGVRVPIEGCGYPELVKFQKYFDKFGIAIVLFDALDFGTGKEILFDGRKEYTHDVFYILYDDEKNHYDLIVNLTAAVSSKFFCSYCNKKYYYINAHTCEKICHACYVVSTCEPKTPLISCPDCLREFYGQGCFDNHRRGNSVRAKSIKTVCQLVRMCPKCFQIVNWEKGDHVCGLFYCQQCQSKHMRNTLCYVQPLPRYLETELESKEDDGPVPCKKHKYLFVFYDFETRQDDPYKNHPSTTVHVPVLCVAQQVCTDCENTEDISIICNTCGIRQHILEHDPVNELVMLYVRRKTNFTRTTLIAHNSSGFDAQFILQALIKNFDKDVPNVILNGSKIVKIEMYRARFIDSLNYFHMKLSALPKAFGLGDSLKKGYFPHLFTSKETINYIGDYPAVKFYSIDTMTDAERADFLEWHAQQRGRIFNMREEMLAYTISDVKILRLCSMNFRKMMKDFGSTDPFIEACTIASACNRLYRKNFLSKSTIGIVPPQGYRRGDPASQEAISWLLYREREDKRPIIHAGTALEYKLPDGTKVDGFSLPQPGETHRGRVYEYLGDWFHGCPSCYPVQRSRKMILGRSIAEVYENTQIRLRRIRRMGYEVHEMWGCEFKKIKKENPEIVTFLNNHPRMMKETLKPRDAFYGGRTEYFKAMYDVAENEKILFTDVVSLYPYICKTGIFPVGHPTIYVGAECEQLMMGLSNPMMNIKGIVKAKVLPPRNLFTPLLPVRVHNRLVFALCRSCVEDLREEPCNHENVEDRCFTGAWVSLELEKAVELGYEILEVYVVWSYHTTQYNKQKKAGGLFSGYIDLFLKLKQEASGYSSSCTTEEAKDRYIREYFEREGILLEKDNIVPNTALKSFAKSTLCVLWGKISERSCLKQTEIIKNREDLLTLLYAPEKEVVSVLPGSDDFVYANWHFTHEAEISLPFTSVVVASFVTAQARLLLYSYLEKLGNCIIYTDTDSTLFITTGQKDEYVPPISTFLGDMDDELKKFGEGTYIKSFISSGPKSYAFRAVNETSGKVIEVCKMKGITLNHQNAKKVNFDGIKKMVQAYFVQSASEEQNINLGFRAIRRTLTHDVITKNEQKTLMPVFKKRYNVTPNLSLPYGYKYNFASD